MAEELKTLGERSPIVGCILGIVGFISSCLLFLGAGLRAMSIEPSLIPFIGALILPYMSVSSQKVAMMRVRLGRRLFYGELFVVWVVPAVVLALLSAGLSHVRWPGDAIGLGFFFLLTGLWPIGEFFCRKEKGDNQDGGTQTGSGPS